MKKMKNNLILTLLISTYSLIWISNKLSLVLENEKYGFYKIVENSDPKNETENKLDSEFLNEIALIIIENTNYSETKKEIISYTFKVKEVCIEKNLPPPEAS
ncbi:hypothetical protein FNW25_13360 [Flavobacterium franklandianum]|uniref:Uncharacterized protein n=1 Tax=Flavobacterium franklandianum TaxID=2594430 RepID=A0A553C6F1_9FLAO|nr:hypothetical protein [Flavobacterium franklandianum]TRX16085.1 hypothetical protein FNW17_14940 [Flavobacterium franklandianum]TRX23384.1 hypothetical protein FNW25_13360 [Flavobacterium franklandianum]